MQIKTKLPAIPNPRKYLNRPVTVHEKVVGRVVHVEPDTEDPTKVWVTAEVSEDVARVAFTAPHLVTIRGVVGGHLPR